VKVLVTGGAGFIGQHLSKALLDWGHDVCVLDVAPLKVAWPRSERLQSIVGSVLDNSLVDHLVSKVNLVIHLAGIAEPLQYVLQPRTTMEINLFGSLNVVRSVILHRLPLLFASTSEIYGLNPCTPWTEDSYRVLGRVQDSRWCYSSSKAAVEHYLHACRQELGMDFLIVRLFNVYGLGLKGRVISKFIDWGLSGEPLEIHGDGNQTRCFVYVDDVIDALHLILDDSKFDGKTYNIGNPSPISVLDLSHMIIELTGSSSPVRFIPYKEINSGYVDIPKRIPSIESIRAAFGWTPFTDLRKGLSTIIEDDRLKRKLKTSAEELFDDSLN
jgi:UDP-glucose 4-epimerase